MIIKHVKPVQEHWILEVDVSKISRKLYETSPWGVKTPSSRLSTALKDFKGYLKCVHDSDIFCNDWDVLQFSFDNEESCLRFKTYIEGNLLQEEEIFNSKRKS